MLNVLNQHIVLMLSMIAASTPNMLSAAYLYEEMFLVKFFVVEIKCIPLSTKVIIRRLIFNLEIQHLLSAKAMRNGFPRKLYHNSGVRVR